MHTHRGLVLEIPTKSAPIYIQKIATSMASLAESPGTLARYKFLLS